MKRDGIDYGTNLEVPLEMSEHHVEYASVHHAVLRIELAMKERWIIDLTHSQYGWEQVLMPFRCYQADRMVTGVSIHDQNQPWREALDEYFENGVEEDSEEVRYKASEDLYNSVDKFLARYGSGTPSMRVANMLDLDDARFEIDKNELLRRAREALKKKPFEAVLAR
jgi:hypothetical protein